MAQSGEFGRWCGWCYRAEGEHSEGEGTNKCSRFCPLQMAQSGEFGRWCGWCYRAKGEHSEGEQTNKCSRFCPPFVDSKMMTAMQAASFKRMFPTLNAQSAISREHQSAQSDRTLDDEQCFENKQYDDKTQKKQLAGSGARAAAMSPHPRLCLDSATTEDAVVPPAISTGEAAKVHPNKSPAAGPDQTPSDPATVRVSLLNGDSKAELPTSSGSGHLQAPSWSSDFKEKWPLPTRRGNSTRASKVREACLQKDTKQYDDKTQKKQLPASGARAAAMSPHPRLCLDRATTEDAVVPPAISTGEAAKVHPNESPAAGPDQIPSDPAIVRVSLLNGDSKAEVPTSSGSGHVQAPSCSPVFIERTRPVRRGNPTWWAFIVREDGQHEAHLEPNTDRTEE